MKTAIAAAAVAVVIGFILGGAVQSMADEARIEDAVRAANEASGNPMGHRAGGRFNFVQYDDNMEILHDNLTGKDWLVWYWRDDVEVEQL